MNKKKFELSAEFSPKGDQPEAIKSLTQGLLNGEKAQTLLGVTGSGKTFTMANVIQNVGKKALILAHNKTLAAQLYGEFKEFFPNNAVEYFVSYYDYYRPEAYVVNSDTYVEKDSSVNDEIDKLRHSATRSLLEREDVIVVASVSCIYGIGSPDEYEEMRVVVHCGQRWEKSDLLSQLVLMQYQRNDYEFARGTFRSKGERVEIFPPYEDSNIIRLEFFDDELESITIVDPLRGSIITKLNNISIYPKSHYVIGREKLKKALETIKIELRERIQYFDQEQKLIEKQRIEQRTLLDIEMMEELGYCSGVENYSRHFTGQKEGDPPPTLIDFFRNDFLLIVDESHITIPQVGGMYRGDRARKMNLVDFGFRLPSALDNRPLNFEEFEGKIDQVVFVSATPGDYELKQTHGEYVEQLIRPTGLIDPIVEVRPANNQVDDLLVEAKKVISEGGRILVTTLTKKLAEELCQFYQGIGLKVKYLHSDIDTIERVEIINELRAGAYDILVGINLLREGLDIPEVSLVAIMDADKEGFLRSERSLIQTIGRAARNDRGKAILYAYKTTESMKKAIGETERRRKLQDEFNQKHGIVPKSIKKAISGGVIETLRGSKDDRYQYIKKELDKGMRSGTDIDKRIKELKEAMKLMAKELRFEEAAQLRDEIKELNELRFLK